MKKFITLTLAAVLLVAALCAARKPFRTYPHTALVTALDEKTDTVTVTDYSGRTWLFTGCEDYCTGNLESWYKYGGAK